MNTEDKCGELNSHGKPCALPAGHGTPANGGPCFLHTKDLSRLCGAKRRRSNERCRRPAGWKTEHPGTGRCVLHGGSTPSHERAAIRTEAQARMIDFAQPVKIDPLSAMLRSVEISAGFVEWLTLAIRQLDDATDREAQILVELHAQERDRLVRASKACADAGVAVKEIQLRESLAERLATFADGIISGLGLNAEQRGRVPEAVRHALLQIADPSVP